MLSKLPVCLLGEQPEISVAPATSESDRPTRSSRLSVVAEMSNVSGDVYSVAAVSSYGTNRTP